MHRYAHGTVEMGHGCVQIWGHDVRMVMQGGHGPSQGDADRDGHKHCTLKWGSLALCRYGAMLRPG
ncbi:hypothetical protein LguiA_002968 [Lonicera macranthoides]